MTGIPAPHDNPEVKYTKIFINNEWIPAIDGSTFAAHNPSTTKEICRVSEGKKADVDAAVKAAKQAFEDGSEWRTMTLAKRGSLLNKLADLIERDRVYIASLESLNNGKIYTRIYLSDLQLVINVLRYFAGWTDKLNGHTLPVDGDFLAYTKHEPIGVCGGITPWNVPLIMLAWKTAPCLAAGNTMVLKPAEETPLSALYIASLMKEAGFPPGVFNVVPGFGETAGAALTHHMDVGKLSFTGSVPVGRLIQKASADSNFKKLTLELGGKSPIIIFPDVAIKDAVDAAHVAIFSQGGQVCCAGSRTYVHEDIYDEFVKQSVEKAKARKLGKALDVTVAQGPQINEEQRSRILKMIDDGLKKGGTLHCGGGKPDGLDGYFVEPTVITDLPDDAELAKEEIFGPVQIIFKFKTVEEVIRRSNTTAYGLVAGVYTNDLHKAVSVANGVKAGTIWVNCFFAMKPSLPFGGYKLSGFGKDMGEEALRSYTEVKSVLMKITPRVTIQKC